MPASSILAAAGTAVGAAVAWCAARLSMIHQHRETVRRLHDADAHLQALVDHSSAAIYLKDREQRFLLVNRRHMELWPVRCDFHPDMTPSDIFPAEVARAFRESDDRVWRSGDEYTFEEDVPVAGGTRTYLSSKFPVRDAAGRIIAVGGISTDITELKRAQESIARTEQILRRLIDVQEAEKQRLCHEFHDGLIQYAVGSKMLLEALDRERMPADALATIDTVVEHLARGLDDGRRAIRGIRPAALDDLGLTAALQELCAQAWPGGPAFDLVADPRIDLVPDGLQTTIYRVVQEAINNAARHSGTARVSVTVRMDADALDVVVADFGNGFDPRAGGRTGFGLIGMEERVRLAGGECRIESQPGVGTRITVHLPLADGDVARDLPADCILTRG